MWIDFSDNNGAFLKIDNTKRSDIKFTTGMELVISINMIILWIKIQLKTDKDEKNKIKFSPYVMKRVL